MPLARANIEGCLLGTLVGDSLGGRVEGLTLAPLSHRYPNEAAVLELVPARYSGASEMTAAVAASLVRFPDFNAADMAAELARRADLDRRYGHGTHAVLERLRAGEPWQTASVGPGGRTSFGNGAAVRSAPIGLLYAHDVDTLRWIAEEAAALTHRHALACEGAVLQAVAVALAASSTRRPIDGAEFLLAVGAQSQMREYRSRYETGARLVERDTDARGIVDRLGNGRTALGSVVTAAFCFARHPESFERAIGAAVALGGDASSIAAMTGAISGASLGASRIPSRWLDRLDDGPSGRASLIELAAGLVAAQQRIH